MLSIAAPVSSSSQSFKTWNPDSSKQLFPPRLCPFPYAKQTHRHEIQACLGGRDTNRSQHNVEYKHLEYPVFITGFGCIKIFPTTLSGQS
jgi:hypothetical protein